MFLEQQSRGTDHPVPGSPLRLFGSITVFSPSRRLCAAGCVCHFFSAPTPPPSSASLYILSLHILSAADLASFLHHHHLSISFLCTSSFCAFLSPCSSCCLFCTAISTALRTLCDTSGMHYILLITQYQRILGILFAQIEQISFEIKSFRVSGFASGLNTFGAKQTTLLFMTQIL